MTDPTAPKKARWVRCPDPDCGQPIYNTETHKDAHLHFHDKLDDRFAEIRQSVVYLGRELDALRAQLREGVPASEAEAVADWDEPLTDEDPTAGEPDEDPTVMSTTNTSAGITR